MFSLAPDSFPPAHGLLKARWAPILLRPILGSPESYVIGVAAAAEDAAYLEQANRLERLQCLFEGNADAVILAARAGLDALQQDIGLRGKDALLDYQPVLSGIRRGELREGEGASLSDIARAWLASISSLYASVAALEQRSESDTAVVQIDGERARDRLPDLVLEYVGRQRPGLVDFFSQEIRDRARRRRSGNPSAVIIDFAGSKVVANFGTLFANNYSTSVDRLKRRLWDLIISRDNERGAVSERKHEILVQCPPANDPQFTERQYARISEGVELLRDQAQQEAVEFYALTTVPEIGDHLVQREAA